MKRIMGSISNPYSEENFEKLFELFLRSSDDNDFYKNIVTYHKDRKDEGEVQASHIRNNFIRVESMPGWIVQRHFSEFFPTKHRIYINAPLNHIGTIVDKFVDSCDTQNLPYELKYPDRSTDRNDTIVIGSSTEAYKSHIEILRQIAEEHPEIIKDCGTPPILTGVLDGWMGLADENVENRYVSYTQSRLEIFKRSVNKYLCSHSDLATQIEAEDILKTSKAIDSIMTEIEEEGLEESELEIEMSGIDMYLNDAKLSLESRKKLAEYMSQNPQALKDIYIEFLAECERKDIDSENPIFYKGSKKEILENQVTKRVDITDDLRDRISRTTATGVANMYLESEYKDYLSINSRVEILTSIFEKEIKDRRDAMLVYDDLTFMGEVGLIDENAADELYPEESLECLQDYVNGQEDISRYFGYTKLPLRTLLKSQGEDLSPEEIKQIVGERMQYIVDYLNSPQLPVEQKRQRIQNDKKLGEEFAKDRYFPFNVRMLLEYQIDLLEDDIEHDDERRETGKKIVSELQEITQDDIDVEKILGKIQPKKDVPEWDLDDW